VAGSTTTWYNRNAAVTNAQANAPCGDWFVPTYQQLQNPGYTCQTYWDWHPGSQTCYWSCQPVPYSYALALGVIMSRGGTFGLRKSHGRNVRAFRCVSY
jgi:hypothetical protein